MKSSWNERAWRWDLEDEVSVGVGSFLDFSKRGCCCVFHTMWTEATTNPTKKISADGTQFSSKTYTKWEMQKNAVRRRIHEWSGIWMPRCKRSVSFIIFSWRVSPSSQHRFCLDCQVTKRLAPSWLDRKMSQLYAAQVKDSLLTFFSRLILKGSGPKQIGMKNVHNTHTNKTNEKVILHRRDINSRGTTPGIRRQQNIALHRGNKKNKKSTNTRCFAPHLRFYCVAAAIGVGGRKKNTKRFSGDCACAWWNSTTRIQRIAFDGKRAILVFRSGIHTQQQTNKQIKQSGRGKTWKAKNPALNQNRTYYTFTVDFLTHGDEVRCQHREKRKRKEKVEKQWMG